MLSKAQISLISSLKNKKYRKDNQLFIAEGIKSVEEFINSSYQIDIIYVTEDALTKLNKIPQNIKFELVSEKDFAKITQLTTPQGVLALVKIPNSKSVLELATYSNHMLVLDNIQDPGNLGTIIRTAEWFGMTHIVCSIDTVDVYNPKVVQATMGSLSRVEMIYTDISSFLTLYKGKKYGALLNGENIYNVDFGESGLIVLGNEGNGIRDSILPLLDTAVTIPRVGNAESLNVAVASTIFCSEVVRKKFSNK